MAVAMTPGQVSQTGDLLTEKSNRDETEMAIFGKKQQLKGIF
jgi:hypothetical protein